MPEMYLSDYQSVVFSLAIKNCPVFSGNCPVLKLITLFKFSIKCNGIIYLKSISTSMISDFPAVLTGGPHRRKPLVTKKCVFPIFQYPRLSS